MPTLTVRRNAAVYIWVDLRRYLFPASRSDPDFSLLNATTPGSPVYKEREARIVAICVKNSVLIGHGSNFFTEELGWFRVTFTAQKEALLLGLDRIWKSLQEAQAEWADD